MALNLQILSVQRTLFDGEIEMVNAPGESGEMGILPGHAPLLTALKEGELRARLVGGGEEHFVIWGGFMEVRLDQVVVLADAAEHGDEIDLTRAEEARDAAVQQLAQAAAGSADLEAARRDLRRSTIRVRTARRRRSDPLRTRQEKGE